MYGTVGRFRQIDGQWDYQEQGTTDTWLGRLWLISLGKTQYNGWLKCISENIWGRK